MQVSEQKKSLHERIDAEQDAQLLESLLNALSLSNDQFQIPDSWTSDIEEGLKDLSEGRVVDEQTFNENVKKWLCN